MELRIKQSADNNKSTYTMAIMAAIFGFMAAFSSQLGMLLIPLVAAPLAVVFVLERGKRRVFSVALPIILVFLDAVFNGYYSFACLASVLVAVLIYLSSAKAFFSKGDGAIAATLALSLLAILMILFYGCYLIGRVDFAAAIRYYRDLVDASRDDWVNMLIQYARSSGYPSTEEVFTPELLGAMYDEYIQALYSLVMIIAFLIVGCSYKLFTSLFAKRAADKLEIYSWRFSLSPIYAIAYLILVVMSWFASGRDAFSVIVENLSSVFMMIFAYIGYVLADAYFKDKTGGRRGGLLVTVLAILLLGSTAMLVLSVFGVIACFMINRAINDLSGTGNNGQGGSDAR